MKNYTQKTIIESKTLLFGDPGCDDVEEILSNKLLQPTSTEQKSSDSEEEDDLQKIFHQVLTRKASEKLANSEIIENDKEEEEKKNELNDKKIKLGKTKSFEVQNNDWILDILKNDIKSKEN